MNAAGLQALIRPIHFGKEEILYVFITQTVFESLCGNRGRRGGSDKVLALTALQPVIEVGNPLGEYPDRSWERVYHDQYRYDSSFTWCCSRTIRMPAVFGPSSGTAW